MCNKSFLALFCQRIIRLEKLILIKYFYYNLKLYFFSMFLILIPFNFFICLFFFSRKKFLISQSNVTTQSTLERQSRCVIYECVCIFQGIWLVVRNPWKNWIRRNCEKKNEENRLMVNCGH